MASPLTLVASLDQNDIVQAAKTILQTSAPNFHVEFFHQGSVIQKTYTITQQKSGYWHIKPVTFTHSQQTIKALNKQKQSRTETVEATPMTEFTLSASNTESEDDAAHKTIGCIELANEALFRVELGKQLNSGYDWFTYFNNGLLSKRASPSVINAASLLRLPIDTKWQLLEEAVINGNDELANILIPHLAEKDGLNRYVSPRYAPSLLMHLAVDYEVEEVLKLLIQHGAKINVTSPQIGVHTPLMHAANKGKTEIVRIMLSRASEKDLKNISIQVAGHSGISALYLASKKGHAEIVTLLLEHGENPNVFLGTECRTPLVQAIISGHFDTALALIPKSRVTLKSPNEEDRGATAIYYAAKKGWVEGVEQLFATGLTGGNRPYNAFDVLGWGRNEFEVLSYAHQHNHLITVSTILGREVQEGEAIPELELHRLLSKGDCTVKQVKKLITNELNVDLVDSNQETYLHKAVRLKSREIIQELLKLGADIHSDTNRLKITPLILAINIGDPNVVEALLSTEGTVTEIDFPTGGYLPLTTAVKNANSKIVTILIKHGANIDEVDRQTNKTALMLAIENQDEEVLNSLLSNNDVLNSKNADGDTVIHILIQQHENQKLTFLIQRVAIDFTVENTKGQTPQQLAEEINNTQAVELIKKAQAKQQLLATSQTASATDDDTQAATRDESEDFVVLSKSSII